MTELFPPSFHADIERLILRFERLKSSSGEGISARSGMHAARDFVGHAPYVSGDDMRSIDWAVYARSERFFLKHFAPERERRLLLAPDVSPSMLDAKRMYAFRLCALLAAAALRRGVHVELMLIGARAGPWRGFSRFPALLAALESAWEKRGEGAASLSAAGGTDSFFHDLGRRLNLPGARPRNTVVLSDLMEEPERLKALLPLAHDGRSLGIVGVLAEDELSPPWRGAVEFRDAENGKRLRLALTPALAAKYRRTLDAHIERWRGLCREAGVGFAWTSTAQSPAEAITRLLPRGGVLA